MDELKNYLPYKVISEVIIPKINKNKLKLLINTTENLILKRELRKELYMSSKIKPIEIRNKLRILERNLRRDRKGPLSNTNTTVIENVIKKKLHSKKQFEAKKRKIRGQIPGKSIFEQYIMMINRRKLPTKGNFDKRLNVAKKKLGLK